MELMEYKRKNRNERIKQIVYGTCMLFVFTTLLIWYQDQVTEINKEFLVVENKSRLIKQLHQQMLTVSGEQFRLLHASDYKEAHELLLSMSEHVSSYVTDLHQFEQIASAEDIELVNKFRANFKKWRDTTDELSSYAHLVSNIDLINVLGAMELNLHRLDEDSPALVIAKYEQQ